MCSNKNKRTNCYLCVLIFQSVVSSTHFKNPSDPLFCYMFWICTDARSSIWVMLTKNLLSRKEETGKRKWSYHYRIYLRKVSLLNMTCWISINWELKLGLPLGLALLQMFVYTEVMEKYEMGGKIIFQWLEVHTFEFPKKLCILLQK